MTALASCADHPRRADAPGAGGRRSPATAPARWLGGISYGLYLVHFPVFVIVDQLDPDAGLVAVAAMVAVAVGLAVLLGRLGRVAGARRPRRPAPPRRARRGADARRGRPRSSCPARSSDADDFLDPHSSRPPPADGATVGAAPPSVRGADAPSRPHAARAGSAAPTVVAWFGDSVALSLLFATTTYVDDGPVRFADLRHVVRLWRRPVPAGGGRPLRRRAAAGDDAQVPTAARRSAS